MDITQQYFTCKKCGESKIWGEFTKSKRDVCIQCDRRHRSDYRAKNRDAIVVYKKQYYTENREKIVEKERERSKAKSGKGAPYNTMKSKAWQNKNRDKYLSQSKKADEKRRQNLSDSYLRKMLKKRLPDDVVSENPELINIQRIIIQTKRLCKT